jgi:alpha-glucosidase
MRSILKLFFAMMMIAPVSIYSQKSVILQSPDGNIIFTFKIINQSAFYNITYKTKVVVQNSQLSLKFSDADFTNDLRMEKPVVTDGEEKYELVVGKTKIVDEQYREALIPLGLTSTNKRKILLAVRAFNDGVAFRYELPNDQQKHSFVLIDENSTFNFAGATIARALFLPNYISSHEGLYHTVSVKDMKEDTLMDMPALFETPDHIFVGITESNLLDYAGMYLIKEKGIIRSKLSPLPNQTEIKVKASLPHNSPWRVMLISDRVGALIESNIVTNLADPCKIKDANWIKPGKTTFPWWNGNVVPDTACMNGIPMTALIFFPVRMLMSRSLCRDWICNRFAITQNQKALISVCGFIGRLYTKN